jgi:glycosyltransferase involved in cell wall biosynthesis
VAIFLCTHQGEHFLPRQLDSVAAQTHADWRIWASDDHSTDGTLAVLQHYRTKWGEDKLSWVRGPGRGFVANFLTLACTPGIESEYYAFCDQDDLWVEAGPDLDIQTHDWWLYILATGCGGLLHYDPVPKVGYRQHPKNIVGSNLGWMPRLRRAYRLLIGRFRRMNDRNFVALRRVRHRMSPEALAVLDEFDRARNAWLLPRIIGIRKSGVYLQTTIGNLGLIAATLLKKL